MSWDQRFLSLAFTISTWSKDSSTKVGCVITGAHHEVRSLGYNGMPRGVLDDVESRYVRPGKYLWFEHAERNAIYNAARMGVSLEGSTLYCATLLLGPPCVDCTRAAIQSGVARIVCQRGSEDSQKWPERWRESMQVSLDMLREAGVAFNTIDIKDGNH
jgi:dCMP deaminase